MSRLLLVLGGARSGKSAYAEARVAGAAGDDVLYVGTMLRGDPDVEARIAAHRARRPAGWTVREADGWTVREAAGAGGAAGAAGAGAGGAGLVRADDARRGVLVDGVELWLAALEPESDARAAELACALAGACTAAAGSIACLVSAEVGLGVVPSTPGGTVFRDRVGAANQALAERADEVVLVVAGLPLRLKPPGG